MPPSEYADIAFNFYEELGLTPPPVKPTPESITGLVSQLKEEMSPLHSSRVITFDDAFNDAKDLLDAYEQLRVAVYEFCVALPHYSPMLGLAEYKRLVDRHDAIVDLQEKLRADDDDS